MKYATQLFAIAGLLPLSFILPAQAAQQLFVAPYGGYSFGGSSFDINQLSVENAQSVNKQSVGIEEASHLGLMLGIGTHDPGNIYLLYSRQSSELKSAGLFTPDLVASLDVDYIHLGGSLLFPNGDFQPYITASVGVTRMMPDDWSTETRFSMGIGGGVEYRILQHFSVFADLRGYATFIDNNGSLFCNENECLWRVTADVMWQVQANLGLKVSF